MTSQHKHTPAPMAQKPFRVFKTQTGEVVGLQFARNEYEAATLFARNWHGFTRVRLSAKVTEGVQ